MSKATICVPMPSQYAAVLIAAPDLVSRIAAYVEQLGDAGVVQDLRELEEALKVFGDNAVPLEENRQIAMRLEAERAEREELYDPDDDREGWD